MQFRYFSCREGVAVSRFGTDAIIGGKYVPGVGYVCNPDEIVAIPKDEVRGYIREYNNALKAGDLIERTESDHSKFVAKSGGRKVVDEIPTDISGDSVEDTPETGKKGKKARKRSGG